jgi:hypothetical protein
VSNKNREDIQPQMAIEEIDFTEGNEEHKEKGLPEKSP